MPLKQYFLKNILTAAVYYKIVSIINDDFSQCEINVIIMQKQ